MNVAKKVNVSAKRWHAIVVVAPRIVAAVTRAYATIVATGAVAHKINPTSQHSELKRCWPCITLA